MADARDIATVDLWRHLSSTVHRLRLAGHAGATLPLLDAQTERCDDFFRPAYALWAAESAAMERDFESAARRHRVLADDKSAGALFGTPWAVQALVGAADAYRRFGALKDALRVGERLLAQHAEHRPPSVTLLHMATAAEDERRDKDAAALYRRAIQAGGEGADALRARVWAERGLARLMSERRWCRASSHDLARELTAALRQRDAKGLSALLSPTHARVGMFGSETVFVDPAAMLDVLKRAMKGASLRVDRTALDGSADKLRLAVGGWNDSLLARSELLIERGPQGWEWVGLGLLPPDAPDEPARKRLAKVKKPRRDGGGDYHGGVDPFEPAPAPSPAPSPPEPAPPAPAPRLYYESVGELDLKCPYPAGLSLRAGSAQFIREQAALAAAAALTGPFWAATLAVSGFVASLTSPCGFGPGGLYYRWGWTHDLDEAFAVDFARFNRGVPWINASRNTPVLAVQQGVVRSTINHVPSGGNDAGEGNEVQVAHIRAAAMPSLMGSITSGTFDPRWRYTSFYLHLTGPGNVPVSAGMFVQQGAVLGFMDNSGTSVTDHLHFSLHDSTIAQTDPMGFWPRSFGMSVRPTPMDGQSLEDWDDGRCLHSNNVPIP